MRILIYISSVTGNTRKIAEAVGASLCSQGHQVENRESVHAKEAEKADMILLCFWCRRGSMDDASLRVLSLYRDQNIIAVGTMGGSPQRQYGQRVRENVLEAVGRNNICSGIFICQGKIAEERTEARRRLSKDSPHYLDDEAYQRHILSRTHPDAQDIRMAIRSVTDLLIKTSEKSERTNC